MGSQHNYLLFLHSSQWKRIASFIIPYAPWRLCEPLSVCIQVSKKKSRQKYGMTWGQQDLFYCWVLFGDFVYIQWLLSLVPRWRKAQPDGSKLPPTKKTRSRRSAKIPNFRLCNSRNAKLPISWSTKVQNCQISIRAKPSKLLALSVSF